MAVTAGMQTTAPAAGGADRSLLPRYMDEAGSFSLLDRVEERALARRLRQAEDDVRALVEKAAAGRDGTMMRAAGFDLDQIRDWSVSELLHFCDELERRAELAPDFASRMRSACDRLERERSSFTEANLRLVIHVAKQYRHASLPMIDLIQEGNLGLLKAVSLFDPDLGVKFSTYAYLWIQQAIDRAAAQQGRVIRLPVNRQRDRKKIETAARSLRAQKGRAPTVDELAAKTEMPASRVEALLEPDYDAKSVEDFNTESSILSLIEDPSTPPPDRSLIDRERIERIREGLAELLSAREERIVRLRFGLDGPGQQSLQEVGRAVGLSRERVRQIEARAIEKLRESDEFVELYGNLGSS